VYGLSGALISAVGLLRSIGMLLGLEVPAVPGITGFVDTDYAAKGRYAREALRTHDLVFVHVEATDECGHLGDFARKITALERIDAEIVGCLVESEWAARGELRILVCPDHPTPCAAKAHTSEPVPFLAWGPGCPASGSAFNETAAEQSGLESAPGHELLGRFLRGQWSAQSERAR
jgi:2,3-bisphosphoglycerate-independent phosphoglycerate mutase